jgi:uncharacterized protein with HEPN domain
MQKDDNVYLGHMLDLAQKAEEKIHGRSREQYDNDEDLRIILAHLIQTIGEAASQVSTPTRAANPNIPWKQIVGIRHHIVHGYMSVDYDIIWEVVTRHLPSLIAELKKIVPSE